MSFLCMYINILFINPTAICFQTIWQTSVVFNQIRLLKMFKMSPLFSSPAPAPGSSSGWWWWCARARLWQMARLWLNVRAIHTHTAGISHQQHFPLTWKMLKKRDKKHLFTSRKYWLLPLSEMGYWCLYPDDDVSENRYSDGTQSRWIEGQPFGGQNVISNLQQSQTIQLRRAGLKHWDISIYVSTTKTFICIKYFFLFEPLNFRRVTFMSKIFWKIFHAFFLQGEILFLKISKVIFLSLHFLYPLDLQLRVLSVIMRLDADRFSSLGCDQTSPWSSLSLSDIIMIHAVFNQRE